MAQNIQHKGIVEQIEGNRVRVVVSQQGACDGCHAKGVCGEKGKERVIDVVTPHAAEFSVGERVIVALLNRNMAYSSVVWAYMLPLVVLLVALFGMKGFGASDGQSALVAIAAIALYYAGLYAFRNKIDKKIEFTIIKE
jgi:sigma-E factor negative regulatory protein RseC